MKFYRQGVFLTCADVDLETATLKKRHDFWARLFDTNAKAMATISLTGIAASIPIDDIYSHDGDEHIKVAEIHQDDFRLCCRRRLQISIPNR